MSKEKTQDNWIYKYANDEKYRQVFNYLVTDVRYVLGDRKSVV